MTVLLAALLVSCALWQADAYPYYPYYYGSNVDTLSYGGVDNTRGGVVLSRYYNPYYNSQPLGGGMAAFMFKQPEEQQTPVRQPSQYYLPDRRRQTPPDANLIPPQENEVYYPPSLQTEKPGLTEPSDIADPTDKPEALLTTPKIAPTPSLPEIIEPQTEEVDEPVQKPRKQVSNRKQVKRPIDDDEDDEYPPKMPAGTFFPMFFGWGGRSGGGAPGGATAIANAYSTGRGGVATSHATAYGPSPDDVKRAAPAPSRNYSS